MRSIYLFLFSAAILLVATSSVSVKSSSGIAGYTGAPGGFGTCGNPGCHSGGSSASSGITITAVPSFSNNEYMPDSLYQVSVQVAAAGFNRYGFDCEILTPNGTNAGVISPTLAAGVKTLTAGSRRDAVHTSPKFGSGGTTFTFPWKAPSTGSLIIYAIANAVNGNGNTSGDFPLTPTTLSLSPYIVPTNTNVTGIDEIEHSVNLKVYPNPATLFFNLDYHLNASARVTLSVTDIKGSTVLLVNESTAQAGHNSQSVDARSLPPGAYFVNLRAGDLVLARKLLVIN